VCPAALGTLDRKSYSLEDMHVPTSAPASKRALLIEPQTLFAPYFVATLEATGLDVVGVAPSATAATLAALQPDVVVVDAGHMPTPLRLVRGVRRRLPNAHIVIYVHTLDAAWTAVARGLGADVVMGPRADEGDLIAAVAPLVPA